MTPPASARSSGGLQAADLPAEPGAAPRPLVASLLVGLGGLAAGVTGPLLSAFVPPLVQGTLGDRSAAIGGVLAIDNVLLLLLTPWAGAVSDRLIDRGRGRLPLILAGLLLAAAGMTIFPASASLGLTGIVAAIVLLYGGINIQRSPFQALIPDLVPSRFRSIATGSATFQMCAGAIVFLMLGRILGMRAAFLIGAGCLVAIAAIVAITLREPRRPARGEHVTYRSLVAAGWSAIRGAVPGLRAVFLATLLLQLTFQTFTTWYALHGIERFGGQPGDVTGGFIAWALGGVVGALPAGLIGVRIGRRNAILLGFALMAACLLALDRVTSLSQATPLLGLASACWTLPMVNAYPLFVEPLPASSRGWLSGLFLLCIALGGVIGDPLNGALFQWFGSYRILFLLMAGYTMLAFATVLLVPRGSGEAGTGRVKQ